MIHPTHYGSDIEIIRADFSLRVIPVRRGRESHACRAILAYRRAKLLTDHEAARALCALNTITDKNTRPSGKGGQVESRRSQAGSVRSTRTPWRLAAFGSPAASSQPLSPTLGLREKMLALARAAIDRVARLLAGRAEDEAETNCGK